MPKKAKGGAKAAAKADASPEGSAPSSPQQVPASAPDSPKQAPGSPKQAPKSPKQAPKSPKASASPKRSKSPAKEQVAPLAPAPVEAPLDPASFDLTLRMTPFLDRHLVLPIFVFLLETGMYKEEDLAAAELHLLSETSMIDYAVDKHGEKANDMLERRDQVLEALTTSRDKVLPLLEILEDEEQVKRISTFKSMEELCAGFDLDKGVIEGLAQYAKLQFDCGNYTMSNELLKHYRSMIQQDAGGGGAKHVSCIWGALASFLLNKAYDQAAEVIFKLDEFLDSTKMSKREVLLHRTWLLHWTLFAIFNDGKVETKLLDFFLNEKSLSIISLSCPHLFRYVGSCLILHKRLKHLVKDTVWIINHEVASYSDPITRLLLALYSDMDFDEAQRMLQQCQTVCRGDFFLSPCWTELEENARLLIFETYCRIHQCINIEMIATKLNMEAEAAELWIVKLIQNAKLDARIDSERSRVVMSKAPPSVYQQVIEKTKNMSFRSTMLLSNLEKREKGQLMS